MGEQLVTGPRWSVAEFDAELQQIGPARACVDEAAARAHFAYVTRDRSQRSDVVQRARSAALLRDGVVVEACSIAPTRRAPWVGSERLRHLDTETRDRLHGLELLAARLVLAGLRRDGRPRVAEEWARVRSVACEVWDVVRGAPAAGADSGGWWLVEWSCRCVQTERTAAALHAVCPYHDTPVEHGPTFVDR